MIEATFHLPKSHISFCHSILFVGKEELVIFLLKPVTLQFAKIQTIQIVCKISDPNKNMATIPLDKGSHFAAVKKG